MFFFDGPGADRGVTLVKEDEPGELRVPGGEPGELRVPGGEPGELGGKVGELGGPGGIANPAKFL